MYSKNKCIRLIAAILLLVLIGTVLPVYAEEQDISEDESEWQNILLLGVDSRDYSKIDRTDTMIILSINKAEEKAKLTSVMRDIWVKFPGTSKSEKINAGTVFGGPELTIRTFNEYFGTDIDSYIMVNFQDITNIVDKLGGIDIEITEGERLAINKRSGENIYSYEGTRTVDKAGLVHMNGAIALAYARDRYSTGAGDFDRVKRQRKVLIEILRNLQKCSMDELLSIALEFIPNVKTNMAVNDILSIVPIAMSIKPGEIDELTIPVQGTYKSGIMGGVWKIVPNFDANRKMIHDFIYGEAKLTEELASGSTGNQVLKLQQKLIELGYLSYADGIFGDLTKAAVKKAQSNMGLEATGIADVDFLNALFE